jgi:hypothetical protein
MKTILVKHEVKNVKVGSKLKADKGEQRWIDKKSFHWNGMTCAFNK